MKKPKNYSVGETLGLTEVQGLTVVINGSDGKPAFFLTGPREDRPGNAAEGVTLALAKKICKLVKP